MFKQTFTLIYLNTFSSKLIKLTVISINLHLLDYAGKKWYKYFTPFSLKMCIYLLESGFEATFSPQTIRLR